MTIDISRIIMNSVFWIHNITTTLKYEFLIVRLLDKKKKNIIS